MWKRKAACSAATWFLLLATGASQPAPPQQATPAAVQRPAPQPAAAGPTSQPVAPRPATQQAAQRSAAQPVAQQPTASPAAQRPAAQPAVQQPAAQPVAQRPATQPAAPRPKVQLDVDPSGPCKAVIAQHCSKASPGPGRNALCLNSKQLRLETPISPPCLDEMRTVFKTLAKFPLSALNGACASEKWLHCKPNQTQAQSFACLKDLIVPNPKRKAVTISAKCREKVEDVERQQGKAIELDDPFFQACKFDLSTIQPCNRIPPFAPSSGKKNCLMRHQKDLSGDCSAALFKRLQKDMRDVRLMPVVFQSCQSEIKQFCGDLAFGEARVLKCLWERQGGASYKCKTQVFEVTKAKLSDYRLDYRIRTRCQKDITTLCQKEQWRVDNLTVQELFGGIWQEGKSGQVLQCLKANFQKIAAPACKPEIQRLVTAHAENPGLDPVFMRTCKADWATHCNKTRPERIHFCLRNHLGNLTRQCRALEIVQGSISAMDISMRPHIKKACTQAIGRYCRDVTHGDAQVIQCLQDHVDDEGVGRQCMQVVTGDLQASNHDWRLKFGVHHACMIDAGRLCNKELPKAAGSVLECLRQNRTKIIGSECRVEIFRFAKQAASNIKFAPNTYAACVQDVNTLCKNVQPGQGRVHNCLVRNQKALSEACSTTEFKEQQLMANDLRLHPRARAFCIGAANRLCPDVPYGDGRGWACMSRHKDDPTMPPACRAILTSHERLQHYEFLLNPQLAKYCSQEAARICPFQAAMSNITQFGSEGATIGCLIENRNRVQSQPCKNVLLEKAIQRLANIDNSPEAAQFCSRDIDRFCRGVPRNANRGLVHKCLQRRMANLSSDCRMVETDLIQMELEDARLLVFLNKDCAPAKTRYCKNVQAGEGRQVMCLLKHMHHKMMEPGCTRKLVSVQKMRATSMRFNPLLSKNCMADLQQLQGAHKTEGTCRPKDDQDVALTGSSIDCLVDHADEVKKPSCQMALLNIMQLQSQDLRARPRMQKACSNDIKALCVGVEAGNGRWHQCLRKNIKRISSIYCKGMVESVWKAEKRDVVLNPIIRGRCQNELHAFCPEVERGESRLLICLLQHRILSGFSEDCEAAIKALHANATIPAVKNIMQELLHKRSFWDTWGTLLMGGVAILLMVWIIALGLLVRWLKKRRHLYGVQVDQPEDAGAQA